MKKNWFNKYGNRHVAVALGFYYIGAAMEFAALDSKSWVDLDIPVLPFGIEIPDGGSAQLYGGLWDVCLRYDNISSKEVIINAIKRFQEIKNLTDEIIDILPIDEFPTLIPPGNLQRDFYVMIMSHIL